jgi:hypothetical protein
MDLDFDYDWRWNEPGQTLKVCLANHGAGQRMFVAESVA